MINLIKRTTLSLTIVLGLPVFFAHGMEEQQKSDRQQLSDLAEQTTKFALLSLEEAADHLQKLTVSLIALKKKAAWQNAKRETAKEAYNQAILNFKTIEFLAAEIIGRERKYHEGTRKYREKEQKSDEMLIAFTEADDLVRRTKREFDQADSALNDTIQQLSVLEKDPQLAIARDRVKALQKHYKNTAIIAKSLRQRSTKAIEKK